MNTKIIKLDINRRLYDKIVAKQDDTGSRFLLFQLLDGAVPFNLTDRSVRVYGVKPDGAVIFNDLTVTHSATGFCLLELTNQMLAIAGTVKLELMITEGDKKLTSIPFEMEVIKKINSNDAVESSNEFRALLNALKEIDDWNKEFADKSGKLEELYTPRLNELGSQLETIETEIDGVNSFNLKDFEKNNMALKTKNFGNGLYVWLENLLGEDFRFALFPKDISTGLGACMKLFADPFQEGSDYRDLGIYFHANQKGDTGLHGKGVWWFNSKVLEGGQFDNKFPDIAFSFQDGKVVACRYCYIVDEKGGRTVALFGGGLPDISNEYADGEQVRAEINGDLGLKNGRKIKFFNKNTKSLSADITARDEDNKLLISSKGGYNFYVDNTPVFLVSKTNISSEVTMEYKKAFVRTGRANHLTTDSTINASDVNTIVVNCPSATSINSITGVNGQEIFLVFQSDNVTMVHGNNIMLNNSENWTPRKYATLTLFNINGLWYEKSRKL